MTLSVSSSHIILVNITKNRVLAYRQLDQSHYGDFIYNWSTNFRTLTILRKVQGQAKVVAESTRVLTLREALDDLASGFELKKAVKMVNKYEALQRDLEPISYLLN